ncbi:hypothetical protein WKH50_21295 [Pantoea agglomerans]|uniref:hypothetical protein n=1 Tax=Enterobacter agglomerans TaxID=549 RepID=UPI003C7E36FB
MNADWMITAASAGVYVYVAGLSGHHVMRHLTARANHGGFGSDFAGRMAGVRRTYPRAQLHANPLIMWGEYKKARKAHLLRKKAE